MSDTGSVRAAAVGAEAAGPAGGFARAEAALLGALVKEPARVMALCHERGIDAGAFDMPTHRAVFATVARMDPNRVEQLTVEVQLARDGNADAAGEVASMVEECTSIAHAEYYADEVADAGRNRRLVALAQNLAAAGGAGDAEGIARTVEAIREVATVPAVNADALVHGADMLTTVPPPHDPIVADVFDVGAVVELLGPPKVRKSFFALQVALTLASGRTGPGLEIATARRVLLANLELTPADMHRRTHRMARALRIEAEDLADRFHVLNLRGRPGGLDAIEAAADGARVEVVMVDPVYTLTNGEENSPATWLPLVARFNAWAARFGAVVYVHHDAKGDIAMRSIADRGAGSNVLGRNAYARMTLNPHKSDPENSVVLAFMLRGYAPRDPLTLTFNGDSFALSDLTPEAQTAADRKARSARPPVEDLTAEAVKIVKAAPLRMAAFKGKAKRIVGTDARVRELLAIVEGDGMLEVASFRGRGRNDTWIGTPAQIATLRKREHAG